MNMGKSDRKNNDGSDGDASDSDSEAISVDSNYGADANRRDETRKRSRRDHSNSKKSDDRKKKKKDHDKDDRKSSRSRHRDDQAEDEDEDSRERRKRGSSRSKRKRRRRDRDDSSSSADENDGSTSDNDSSDSDEDQDVRWKRRHGSSSRKSKYRDRDRKHDRKHRDEKKKKKGSKDKKRKSRRDRYNDSDNDEEDRRGKRKRNKKDRSRKRKNDNDDSDNDNDDDSYAAGRGVFSQEDRDQRLVDAIQNLVHRHPELATELPIILIRLVGGATFDLSQMTDIDAAVGLSHVFMSLRPFGVSNNNIKSKRKNDDDAVDDAAAAAARDDDKDKALSSWIWSPPEGVGGSMRNRDELLLIKVVRAVFDQVGITMDAVHEYETIVSNQNNNKKQKTKEAAERASMAVKATEDIDMEILKEITLFVQDMIQQLGNKKNSGQDNDNEKENKEKKLGQELAGICNMILEGESIAIDGIPDETLRTRLTELFDKCGLEKSEMEEDDEEDEKDENDDGESDKKESGDIESKSESNNNNTNNKEVTYGYGLPDNQDHDKAKTMISTVIDVCLGKTVMLQSRLKSAPSTSPSAAAAAVDSKYMAMGSGPIADSDSEEDEGPAPFGAQKTSAAASVGSDAVKARAAQRARELSRVKAGLDPGVDYDETKEVREEWMIVPGKQLDFLGAIKSGQVIRSRQFKNNKNRGDDGGEEVYIDPKMRAEMDAIHKAHQEARGPSLMELHRQKKATEAAEAARASRNDKGGKDKSWKWNRDKDLDAGRRVDKDALKMVLGGASSGLKTKFHGGFG